MKRFDLNNKSKESKKKIDVAKKNVTNRCKESTEKIKTM